MEELAYAYCGKHSFKKIKVKDGFVNLSGIENIATLMLKDGKRREEIAAFVFDTLAIAITEMTLYYLGRFGDMPVVYAGGVMSNSIIKSHIRKKIKNCCFAETELSKDNAVGVAVLALNHLKGIL